MRKFPVILLGLIGVIGVVGGIAWVLIQRGASGEVLVDQLSPRAQEFIAADTSQGSGMWTEVNLNDSTADTAAPGTRILTRCFAITLPQRTLNHKAEETEQSCVFRARSLAPAGTLVVSAQRVEDFETHTSLTLRQDNPDVYTSHTRTFSNWPVSAVYSDTDSVVAFGWRDGMLYTVALSDMANTSSEKIDVVSTILESIEVLP